MKQRLVRRAEDWEVPGSSPTQDFSITITLPAKPAVE